jgi:hypothetical protein
MSITARVGPRIQLVIQQHRNLDLLAVDAALGVPLFDGELDGAPVAFAKLAIGAGQGRGHADLDRIRRQRGPRNQGRHGGRQPRRRGFPVPGHVVSS